MQSAILSGNADITEIANGRNYIYLPKLVNTNIVS